MVASSIAECEASCDETENVETLTVSNEILDIETNSEPNCDDYQQEKRENRRKSRRRLDDSFDISDNSSYIRSNVESDSDAEIYQIRPTRSGRLPKVKKLQAPEINTLDSGIRNKSLTNIETTTLSQNVSEAIEHPHTSPKTDIVKTSCDESITTLIPDINKIEPGSLVILSKESTEEPGNTILQVYMVKENSDIDNANGIERLDTMPMNLSPELLSTVTSNIKNVEPININECE